MEESLAMPHAWVNEPSIYDVNPPKLYRLIDLEKLEDSVEGAQTTLQAQGVNPNISLSDRSPEVNSLTSNDLSGESVLTVENDSTTQRRGGESPVLTVESDTTTQRTGVETPVSTKVESFVLTVEPELVTLRCESVRSEQIASKPLPISVRSSSTPVGNTSTSNELPGQPVLTVVNDTTTQRTEAELVVLTVESETTTQRTGVESPVLTAEPAIDNPGGDLRGCSQVENDTTEGVSEETTQRSNKRRKGEGTGRIQLRTITKKNGKQYQQFWYDWQVHTKEKIIYKSVYIPKRLLEKIQVLESAKAPVSKILEVLGVVRK